MGPGRAGGLPADPSAVSGRNRAGAAADQSAEGRSLCRGGRLAQGTGDAAAQRASNAAAPAAGLLADRCRRNEDRQCQDRAVSRAARLRRLAGDQRQDGRGLLGRGQRRQALEAEADDRGAHPVGDAAVDGHAAPAGRAEERRDDDPRQDGHPAAALLRTGAATGAGTAGRTIRRERRAHGGHAAGQSRPGASSEIRRPGAAAARPAERLRRRRSSARRAPTRTRSAACWRRTSTSRISTSPASTG